MMNESSRESSDKSVNVSGRDYLTLANWCFSLMTSTPCVSREQISFSVTSFCCLFWRQKKKPYIHYTMSFWTGVCLLDLRKISFSRLINSTSLSLIVKSLLKTGSLNQYKRLWFDDWWLTTAKVMTSKLRSFHQILPFILLPVNVLRECLQLWKATVTLRAAPKLSLFTWNF